MYCLDNIKIEDDTVRGLIHTKLTRGLTPYGMHTDLT